MNTPNAWNELPLGRFEGLWRIHADRVNQALYKRWFGKSVAGVALKTDAFEEAVGTGPLAGTATSRVILLDVSETMLKQALQRHPAYRGIVCDARALPLRSTVDRVLSFSTFDHFVSKADVRTAIENTYTALRAGGKALIQLDNPRNPAVAVRNRLPVRWMGRSRLLPYFMGATLSLRELRQEVERCGFLVEDSAVTLHCPRIMAIPISGWLGRAPQFLQRTWLQLLGACEVLENLPTREFTGHFVAVLAVKDSPSAAGHQENSASTGK